MTTASPSDPVRIAATWNVIWNGHKKPVWRQPVSKRPDAGMFETSVHNAVDRLVWSDANWFHLSAEPDDWVPRCEITQGVYLTVKLDVPVDLADIDERLFRLIPTARDKAWAEDVKFLKFYDSYPDGAYKRAREAGCRLKVQLV